MVSKKVSAKDQALTPSAEIKAQSAKKSPPTGLPNASAPPSASRPAVIKTKKTPAGKRKRLAKAFVRPLDKTRQKGADNDWVKESFKLPATEYAQLGELKKRLRAQHLNVKKSELLRASLRLLCAQDDALLSSLFSDLSAAARVPDEG